MATNTEVKQQLANRAKNNTLQTTPEQNIAVYMEKMKPQFAKVLPKHVDIERLTRIALTIIRTTPKLLNCKIDSLMAAVMTAAELGLEPGLTGHCYIIPYGEEATFIIGYRGMIDLARRSGDIKSIYAHCVYKNDEFDYELGLDPKIKHKPILHEQTGELIGVYAVAHFKDNGYQMEFMPKAEIDRRRERSKASKNGPWVTDYKEMAKKTVIRNLWKYLPISVEIQEQVTQDGTIRKKIAAEPEYIDVEIKAEHCEEETEQVKKNEESTKGFSPDDISFLIDNTTQGGK